MSLRQVGLLFLGIIAVIVGGWFGLIAIFSVIRARPADLWEILRLVFRVVLGAYFLYSGIQMVGRSQGKPRPETRFGWGRILFGSFVIYSSALDHFHRLPNGPIKQLQPENETQASAIAVTTIAMLIGCAALVVWGIAKGFRNRHADIQSV